MTMTDLTSTHLHSEIHEQPNVIEELLGSEQTTAQELAAAIRSRAIDHIVIAARGTSDNAARYAQYVFGTMNRLPVGLAAPSMFTLYQRPPVFGNALVLGISQSGKSPDIVSVLAEARRQGSLTAAITNEAGSDLAQAADFVIPLHAGKERAVAATKTYTAELAAIALISAMLAQDGEMLDDLRRVPAVVRQTLEVEAKVEHFAPRYRYMTRSVAVGRGYNYSTAFEMALKLKEMTYTIVEPYSSADFLHGPLAMIEQGFPVMMVAASGVLLAEMQSFIRTIQDHKAEVLVISDDAETLGMSPLALPVPAMLPEWLSPISMIVPGQLLSLHLASVRGFNVDQPRSINKVTETV